MAFWNYKSSTALKVEPVEPTPRAFTLEPGRTEPGRTEPGRTEPNKAPAPFVVESAPQKQLERSNTLNNISVGLRQGTVLHGRLEFDHSTRLEGTLFGEIFSHKTILVGPNSEVHANVAADTVIIHGLVQGRVTARRIELASSGTILGSIRTPAFTMEAGARFNGNCDNTPWD